MAVKPQLDPASLVGRIDAELQANPEAQRLMLRTLWTNEFLGLPAGLYGIEKDVAEIKADIAPRDTDVSQHTIDLDPLRSWDLARHLRKEIVPLTGELLDLGRIRVVQRRPWEPNDAFMDRVQVATFEGRITKAQAHRIYSTDFIMDAQWRDETPVWVPVEASFKVRAGNIGRACASAHALQAAFGVDAVAIVAGFGIDQQDLRRAEATRVHYVEASVPEWCLITPRSK